MMKILRTRVYGYIGWLGSALSGHWKGNRFIDPISFACCLTNKVKEIYSELLERIYHRIEVISDRFELKISSQLKTETGRFTLSITTDDDVTSKNFRALCTGEKGIGKIGKPLHYKGTTFRRVIPGFIFHGNGNRTGCESIYGASFADENFVNQHIGLGILSMANTSLGTNGYQFFICTVKTEWLDGKYVVFGQVVEGFDIMKTVEKVGSRSGMTSKPVMVADCGQLS
ncbi:hypothetical protein Dsin_011821 [Dipteronia sinensis]|uniref:Peptidyl-prolyl cis-trans isomerase n=1 Tax=Dipteronia sinensis TaxID=43782 RepID=A0AAE0E7G3_9ROSI|nr:hypothetical protein Dsin_011821 [Dipteronia sinensis]